MHLQVNVDAFVRLLIKIHSDSVESNLRSYKLIHTGEPGISVFREFGKGLSVFSFVLPYYVIL